MKHTDEMTENEVMQFMNDMESRGLIKKVGKKKGLNQQFEPTDFGLRVFEVFLSLMDSGFIQSIPVEKVDKSNAH